MTQAEQIQTLRDEVADLRRRIAALEDARMRVVVTEPAAELPQLPVPPQGQARR